MYALAPHQFSSVVCQIYSVAASSTTLISHHSLLGHCAGGVVSRGRGPCRDTIGSSAVVVLGGGPCVQGFGVGQRWVSSMPLKVGKDKAEDEFRSGWSNIVSFSEAGPRALLERSGFCGGARKGYMEVSLSESESGSCVRTPYWFNMVASPLGVLWCEVMQQVVAAQRAFACNLKSQGFGVDPQLREVK
ncbi:hypothetical protein EDB89DRAFT_1902629 [Lactarius sanguifluus]|nr:hypothetical protein EDB89DRAFT_1902629 [Lactarius sanguifluus]